MFLGDSIGRAVEELWQLAMTMASLKHIAGMVTQELQTTTASTGLEEENFMTTDSHRPSQVDKTEVVSNKCFANNEIIANEKTAQDAFISSAQKKEISSHPAEHLLHLKEDENECVQISMVAHQLPQHDAPQESSELPVSMAAHVIATNDEEDRMDQHQNISMVVHQITDQNKTVKPVMIEEEKIEETGIWFIPSMCTRDISYLDTPAESSEHQVSMVAHYQQTFENSDIEHANGALTRVCQQTSEHYNVQEYQVEKQEQELELLEEKETDEAENLTPITSMVSHQLSYIDTLLEVSEIAVSMATHVIASNDMKDTIESPQTISMIAHQILNEDKSIAEDVAFSIINITKEETDAANTENICNEDICFNPSVCTLEVSNTETRFEITKYDLKEDEEKPKIQSRDLVDPEFGENEVLNEPTFISSMVAHQLAPLDNVLESSEISLTMAAHVIITDWENILDTHHDISMIVHQISNQDTDIELTVNLSIPYKIKEPSDAILLMNTVENVFIPSMCTHEMSYLDTPTESFECQVSMVTHYQHTPEDRFEHEDDVLSMVCHHETIHNTVKQYLDVVLNKTEVISKTELSKDEEVVLTAESTFPSSMVVHQLPTLDTLLEFSDMPASMTPHIINTNDMDAGETYQIPFLITDLHAQQECSASMSVYIGNKSATSSEQIKDNLGAMVCSMEENILEYEKEICPGSLKSNYHGITEEQEQSFISSMVSHQLPLMETPNEFQNFLVSSSAHGYSLIIQEDQGLVSSMLTHQSTELNTNNTTIEEAEEEEREHLSSLVSHQLPIPLQDENFLVTHCSPSEESLSPQQSGIDNSMLACHNKILEKEDLKGRLENMDHNPSYNSDQLDVAFMTSLASHQLPLLSPCEQLESHDCITSMAAHQDMATREEREFASMATHIASNDVRGVNQHQSRVDQDEEEISKPNEIIQLVENMTRIYTEGSHMIEHKEDLPQEEEDSSNICLGIITVGTEEEEDISETFDKCENAADNNEVVNSYSSKLDRILELQRLVEDEIEEFENKKNNNSNIIENNVEKTETHIVSNVKNVEFQSCIVIYQQVTEEYETVDPEHILDEQFNEEYEKFKNEENWTDDESFYSSSESVNSVICTTSEKLKRNDEQKRYREDESFETYSDKEDVVENVIEASCTLENNSTVVITTNHLPSNCFELEPTEQDIQHETEQQNVMKDNQQKENANLDQSFEEQKEDFDVETELLNSLFKEGFKEAEKKCKEKPQEKTRKSSMTLVTFNESVKKQTYKIRFKVRLNKDSSKASVLQYLLGCFGGEKLFHQK